MGNMYDSGNWIHEFLKTSDGKERNWTLMTLQRSSDEIEKLKKTKVSNSKKSTVNTTTASSEMWHQANFCELIRLCSFLEISKGAIRNFQKMPEERWREGSSQRKTGRKRARIRAISGIELRNKQKTSKTFQQKVAAFFDKTRSWSRKCWKNTTQKRHIHGKKARKTDEGSGSNLDLKLCKIYPSWKLPLETLGLLS